MAEGTTTIRCPARAHFATRLATLLLNLGDRFGEPNHVGTILDIASQATGQTVSYTYATPGTYSLSVRATNTRGETQTADRATPFPAGSTGIQEVVVTVS